MDQRVNRWLASSTLQDLTLYENLGRLNAGLVSVALAKNKPPLQRLILSRANDDEVVLLLDGIKANKTLLLFQLQNPTITQHTFNQLVAAIHHNTCLEKVLIGGDWQASMDSALDVRLVHKKKPAPPISGLPPAPAKAVLGHIPTKDTHAAPVPPATDPVLDGIFESNAEKNTPLHLIMYKKDVTAAHLLSLLDKFELDINAANVVGLTPLHLAVLNGREHLLVPLIHKGADVYAKDSQERTAYTMALALKNENMMQVLKGHYDSQIFELLATNSSKLVEHIQYRSSCGDTVIHLAVKHMALFSLEALLKVCDSATLNVQNTYMQQTALHTALAMKNQEAVKLLLARDPNLFLHDAQGNTVLHLAAKHNVCLHTLLAIPKVVANLLDRCNNEGSRPEDLLHGNVGIIVEKRVTYCLTRLKEFLQEQLKNFPTLPASKKDYMEGIQGHKDLKNKIQQLSVFEFESFARVMVLELAEVINYADPGSLHNIIHTFISSFIQKYKAISSTSHLPANLSRIEVFKTLMRDGITAYYAICIGIARGKYISSPDWIDKIGSSYESVTPALKEFMSNKTEVVAVLVGLELLQSALKRYRDNKKKDSCIAFLTAFGPLNVMMDIESSNKEFNLAPHLKAEAEAVDKVVNWLADRYAEQIQSLPVSYYNGDPKPASTDSLLLFVRVLLDRIVDHIGAGKNEFSNKSMFAVVKEKIAGVVQDNESLKEWEKTPLTERVRLAILNSKEHNTTHVKLEEGGVVLVNTLLVKTGLRVVAAQHQILYYKPTVTLLEYGYRNTNAAEVLAEGGWLEKARIPFSS